MLGLPTMRGLRDYRRPLYRLCDHLSILSSCHLGDWVARRIDCHLLILLSLAPLFGAACQPRLWIIRSKTKLRTSSSVEKCQG